jgi:hypothetical protein
MLATLALAIIGLAGLAFAAGSPPSGTIELKLAHPPASGEETWLRVQVGTLPRGALVRVSTADGQVLESVQPFGAKAAQSGGLYTVPLPKGTVVSRRARLRVEVIDSAGAAHAPSAAEVERVELINVPVSR